MQRIAVVGCIGAGKTTLADAMGKALRIEVFHLDGLWWQPGTYRITGRATVKERTIAPGELRRLEESITAGASWIVDGEATNKDLRLSRADTVVFIDLPRWLCTWRLLKRHFRRRPELPDGVDGSVRWTLLLVHWIWRTWPSKRRPSLIEAIAMQTSPATVFRLRSRREIRSFLATVAPARVLDRSEPGSGQGTPRPG